MRRIRICDHDFEGPVDLNAPGVPDDRPGVYVIICDCADGPKRMADAGRASNIAKALTDRENQQQWRKPYDGPLSAYVWYPADGDPADACERLVEAIRERYSPICSRGR